MCTGLGECVGTCPNSGQMPLGVYRVCGTCGVDANNVQTFVDHATYKCVSVCPAGFIATTDDKVATLHARCALCLCWLYTCHARSLYCSEWCAQPTHSDVFLACCFCVTSCVCSLLVLCLNCFSSFPPALLLPSVCSVLHCSL